jgi:hypothetical protein
MQSTRFLARSLSIAAAFALTLSSASAALVTWEFNPSGLNQAAGTGTLTYLQSGAPLTVTGRGNLANGATGVDPLEQLYYKNEPPHGGATERGLGIANSDAHELNIFPNGTPVQYMQLDLRALLAQGFMNGELAVGSMQNGEGFRLFGSNIEGALGMPLPGTWTGLAFDANFVAIPSFGSFNFVSIAAASGRILPIAFRAEPIPELSALLPILGLLAAVGGTQLARRRARA